jgi:regulator of replication initiation timing
LRNSIHEKVSELRNIIYIIKDNLHKKVSENTQLQNEVNEMKKSNKAQMNTQANGQLATSMCNTQESSTKEDRTDNI